VAEHSWSKSGLYHRKRAERFTADHPGTRYVVVHGGAGKAPFHAGPDVIYVDPLALTDPLLSRLPDADGKFWFSGHLGRHVPKGYAHARRTGSLEQMDPDLAAYYHKIRVITRGPLLSWQRIATIARFHLGQYDHHLQAYLKGGYRRERGKK
jgi:arabinofuranosyltransferase